MILVPSAVDEGKCARTRPLPKPLEISPRLRLVELLPVTVFKFIPPLSAVTEPGDEFRGWRDCLHPTPEIRLLLAESTWPVTIDQHPRAILPVRRFIHSLYCDGHDLLGAARRFIATPPHTFQARGLGVIPSSAR